SQCSRLSQLCSRSRIYALQPTAYKVAVLDSTFHRTSSCYNVKRDPEVTQSSKASASSYLIRCAIASMRSIQNTSLGVYSCGTQEAQISPARRVISSSTIVSSCERTNVGGRLCRSSDNTF